MSMSGHDLAASTAENYRVFAAEARGRSPRYVELATAGKHTLRVRATDKTGYTQTPVYQKPEPNGATGYHTVQVTVA